MAAQIEEVDVNVGADWSNYPDMPEVEERSEYCGEMHAGMRCTKDPGHAGLHAAEDGFSWGWMWRTY